MAAPPPNSGPPGLPAAAVSAATHISSTSSTGVIQDTRTGEQKVVGPASIVLGLLSILLWPVGVVALLAIAAGIIAIIIDRRRGGISGKVTGWIGIALGAFGGFITYGNFLTGLNQSIEGLAY
ncbi:hypothetical protein [Agromyces humi]|uniref:hypothetical protein n=1 Tax=Agromyces humi TaxID=1766800 RepID=UPI001F460045|nr:hypothetical protein [Agromyces humi]